MAAVAHGEVHDLSGNVTEWAYTSNADDGPVHGGSYAGDADSLICGASMSYPATSREPTVGFRCCTLK